MRGRKPKPTKLKVLSGNPDKRPLNYNEPRPEPAVPDCPPELSKAAQFEWNRLVVELGKLNLLTHLDRAAPAAYCNAYAMWVEAILAIQKFGSMVKSPNESPVQSPYVEIANRQAEIMLRISVEFGFTPAIRGRIAARPVKQGELFEVEGAGKSVRVCLAHPGSIPRIVYGDCG